MENHDTKNFERDFYLKKLCKAFSGINFTVFEVKLLNFFLR